MKRASTPKQMSRLHFKPKIDVHVTELGYFSIVFGPPLLTAACVGSELRQVDTKPGESDKKRHVAPLVLFVATTSHLVDYTCDALKVQLSFHGEHKAKQT
jgi:hypothetical protein